MKLLCAKQHMNKDPETLQAICNCKLAYVWPIVDPIVFQVFIPVHPPPPIYTQVVK